MIEKEKLSILLKESVEQRNILRDMLNNSHPSQRNVLQRLVDHATGRCFALEAIFDNA